jgi:hypothetical protein
MCDRYDECSYGSILGVEGGVCGAVYPHGDAEGELCEEFGMGRKCGCGYGVVCDGGEGVGRTVGAIHIRCVVSVRYQA